MPNSGGSFGVLNSSCCSELQTEESGSHVNEIVESSMARDGIMVNAAIQAFSSMKGGGNTFQKIEEAIDYVYGQLPSDDYYVQSERTGSDDMACQEQLQYGPFGPLQAQPTPLSKSPFGIPSELITKCVASKKMEKTHDIYMMKD